MSTTDFIFSKSFPLNVFIATKLNVKYLYFVLQQEKAVKCNYRKQTVFILGELFL